MTSDGRPDDDERRARITEAFQAYAGGISELGREFARRTGQHHTDSAAIVAILRAEQRGTPLTPARLAERIGLTSGATSILLNRLEDAGHVVRRRGHADRRIVTLHSTPAIHDTAERYFAPLRARLDRVMDDYTPEQLDLVEAFVTALHDTVEDHIRADADSGDPP